MIVVEREGAAALLLLLLLLVLVLLVLVLILVLAVLVLVFAVLVLCGECFTISFCILGYLRQISQEGPNKQGFNMSFGPAVSNCSLFGIQNQLQMF